MSANSRIEWTDATWNPWYGCHKISPGCKNCYMFREQKMYGRDPNVVTRSKTTFDAPLKWKEPKKIFTCSWSDWLIEEADAWREEAYGIIRRTPWHTYQILTKRIERAAEHWPGDLPNAWLGVSCEDQKTADERIPLLLQTPAVVRFVSAEPLLGPIDFRRHIGGSDTVETDLEQSEAYCIRCGCRWNEDGTTHQCPPGFGPTLDWVIVGGESGPGARPMYPQWARDIRDQCQASGVAFFFKQWGEVRPQNPAIAGAIPLGKRSRECSYCGPGTLSMPMIRVGKKAAGRLLDGREWNEFPEQFRKVRA